MYQVSLIFFFITFSFQIKHACGNPSLAEKTVDGATHTRPRLLKTQQSNSWPSPIHTILIDFMSSIDRAKDFFMRISDRQDALQRLLVKCYKFFKFTVCAKIIILVQITHKNAGMVIIQGNIVTKLLRQINRNTTPQSKFRKIRI